MEQRQPETAEMASPFFAPPEKAPLVWLRGLAEARVRNLPVREVLLAL